MMLLKCNRKFLECDKNERSVKHTLPEGTLCYALPKRLFVVKLYVFLIKKTDISKWWRNILMNFPKISVMLSFCERKVCVSDCLALQ